MKRIPMLIMLMAAGAAMAATAGEYALKYDRPAVVWEEALPLGSGAIGAMVWGGVSHETVDLNEDTVWSGSPNSNVNPGIRGRLDDIRKAILEGRFNDAKPDSFPGARNHGMNYQFPGSLKLDFDGVGEKVDGYMRTLSLDDAFARVAFAADGVRHDRAAFTPLGKGGFVYRLKADRKGALAFRASLKRAHDGAVISVEDGTLVLRGVTSDKDGVPGKVRYTVIVKVAECDGAISADGESLRVSDASRAAVYVAIGTNFKRYDDISGDADAVAKTRLAELTASDVKTLFAAHMKAYRAQADRCTLDLGPDKFPQKTTDRRLADFASSDDPYFAALYFRFGRYLLISCSQPGTQPANLQGLWNNTLTPPWTSKYTVNINTEMNYWPSEVTNLSELSEPLFAMLEDLSVTGAKAAEEMYGAKGWVTHHNTDIWRIAGPVDTYLACGWWPSGGGWLSTHLWEHYLYTRDRDFLAKSYPILRGAAEFFDTFAVVNPETGHLAFIPSNSPENTPFQRPHGIDPTCTMDHAIVRDVWNSVIEAARVLGRDTDYAAHLAERVKMLEPYHVGNWGQLQEWGKDVDVPWDTHRHVSHLYGLYPSAQITPETPELFSAARVSLEKRGDVSTGWAMGWRVCLWARLFDGDHAFRLIQNQLSPLLRKEEGVRYSEGGTYPNLFDAHPPFQIDGNFGCTAGIAEMLMQSHRGFVELLPALPKAWPNGSVKGLRARGGWTVGFTWKNGAVTDCKVKAGVGGKLKIKINGVLKEYDAKAGETVKPAIPKAARAAYPSPSGRLVATLRSNALGRLSWRVDLDGKRVMDESRLGVKVDGVDLGSDAQLGEPASRRIKETYDFNGNHRTAVSDCIEYVFPVLSRKDGKETMKLALRCFDDGAAVRYILPGKGARRIDCEATEWTAPAGSKVWFQPNTYCYEDEFDCKGSEGLDIGRVVALPITVKIPGAGYALYTEANLVNYTDLAVKCGSGGRFSAAFAANEDKNGFEQSGDGVTPWRVVIAARDLNSFFNSDVVKNLCPPADGRAKGIAKPGRSVWHWLPDDAPKFADQKGWIDRTAELGYEYYLVDMDWRDWKDSGRSSLECLKEVVDYAREKGVKIVVWRHSNDIFERDARRRFFGEMKSLGVVGVKPDFPADTGIKWVNWYEDTLRDAAEFGLMIDFHGAIKPTGRERTWPNEVAREAIRGHEWHITRYNRVLPARHDCILPFNRLIQGHADYTPVVLNERELVGYTRTRELAQGVVFSAPFFCTGDYPQNYLDSPAVDFIKALPAVYDETRVLEPTEIGEVVVFAKRSGSCWFVGVENGEKEREFDLKLDFLGKDRWKLVSYSDSEKGPTELTREERTVTSADTLSVKCAARGGFAAWLRRQ